MTRRLTSYEQETIINFNKEEKIAYIFTYEKTWQQHIENKLGLKPVMDNGYGGKEYEISKKRIKPPRAPIKLSPERRARLAEGMRQKSILSARNKEITVKSSIKKQNKGTGVSRTK